MVMVIVIVIVIIIIIIIIITLFILKSLKYKIQIYQHHSSSTCRMAISIMHARASPAPLAGQMSPIWVACQFDVGQKKCPTTWQKKRGTKKNSTGKCQSATYFCRNACFMQSYHKHIYVKLFVYCRLAVRNVSNLSLYILELQLSKY